MYICTNCLSLNVNRVNRELVCHDCSFKQSKSNYDRKLRIAKECVRLGFQYRKRYEYDLKLNRNSKKNYYLKELHDAFAFLGLAVISGIAGNFAYDKLKQTVKRIIDDPLIIEIKDKEFQRLLKSQAQQNKFIKYIEQYRNKTVPKPKKKKTTNSKIKKFEKKGD